MVDDPESNAAQPRNGGPATGTGFSDRILAFSGYFLIAVSVFSFGVLVYIKLKESVEPKGDFVGTWLGFVQRESVTLSLLVLGIVAALLGKRLMTSFRLMGARTIPIEDLPLVKQAVIDGKPEPIDQYVRLRSLTGFSGTFQKLGITGLPLTTVFLTLVFSFVSLITANDKVATSFLDLAKLTLGAFIGSFVQRQVEQRRQQEEAGQEEAGTKPRPELAA
jgi:hypothetical protein